jgi:hypothetical protein
MENNITIKKITFALFAMALLFQNSFSLIISSVYGTNSTIIFLLKDFLIIGFVLLILATRKSYIITKPDLVVFIMAITYVTQSIANYNGIMPLILSLKYFISPLLLYYVGRYWFRGINLKTICQFIILMVLITFFISIGYLLIEKKDLIDMNIWTVFESKGQDVQGGRFIDGFPANFYSYYGGYRIMRLFGPFLDPLTTGFFLVPLLSFSKIQAVEYKRFFWKLIFLLLFALLLLSQTRAILFSFIAASFIVRCKNGKYKMVPLGWIFGAIVISIASIVINYQALISFVDPSTWGHLNAYYSIIAKFSQEPLYKLLIGTGIPEDLVVGNESLFTSMIVYNGILYLILFNWFVITAVKNLSNSYAKLRYISLVSMITYYFASFTTEHWFATTSSGLFWILLGMSINDEKTIFLLCWNRKREPNEDIDNIYALRP